MASVAHRRKAQHRLAAAKEQLQDRHRRRQLPAQTDQLSLCQGPAADSRGAIPGATFQVFRVRIQPCPSFFPFRPTGNPGARAAKLQG